MCLSSDIWEEEARRATQVLPESRGSTTAFMDAQSFKNCHPVSEGLEQCMGQSQHVLSLQTWNWGIERTILLERGCAL